MAVAFTDWEGTCLIHHGIKGQKWGVRRFQNPDGTLTELGKKRAQKETYKTVRSIQKDKTLTIEQKQDKIAGILPKDRLQELSRIKKQEEIDILSGKKKYDETLSNEYDSAKMNFVNDVLGKYGKKHASMRAVSQSVGKATDEMLYGKDLSGYDKLVKQVSAQKDSDNKKAFDDFNKALRQGKNGLDKYFRTEKGFDNEKLDKVYNHIEKKESKLIDEWWKKKTTGDWRSKQTRESFDAEAMRYAKQAARDMGLPVNQETLYFLLDWFFNGDD